MSEFLCDFATDLVCSLRGGGKKGNKLRLPVDTTETAFLRARAVDVVMWTMGHGLLFYSIMRLYPPRR